MIRRCARGRHTDIGLLTPLVHDRLWHFLDTELMASQVFSYIPNYTLEGLALVLLGAGSSRARPLLGGRTTLTSLSDEYTGSGDRSRRLLCFCLWREPSSSSELYHSSRLDRRTGSARSLLTCGSAGSLLTNVVEAPSFPISSSVVLRHRSSLASISFLSTSSLNMSLSSAQSLIMGMSMTARS